jgi:hypothetical protein
MFATFIDDALIVERFANPETLRVEMFEIPETFREDRTPTLVILGWSGCETTRATFAFATFPTSTELSTFVSPLP